MLLSRSLSPGFSQDAMSRNFSLCRTCFSLPRIPRGIQPSAFPEGHLPALFVSGKGRFWTFPWRFLYTAVLFFFQTAGTFSGTGCRALLLTIYGFQTTPKPGLKLLLFGGTDSIALSPEQFFNLLETLSSVPHFHNPGFRKAHY